MHISEWLEGKVLVANPIPNAVEHPRRWAQNLELKAPPGDRFNILNRWAYALMISSIQTQSTITNCPPGQLSESDATNAPSKSDPRKKFTHAPESGTKSKQLPQTNCPQANYPSLMQLLRLQNQTLARKSHSR